MKTHTNNIKRYYIASVLILGLIAQPLYAQKGLNLKQYLLPGSAMLVSGFLDGTIETISFHYDDGFKPVFPHANDQFWNPALSWTNKYRNGSPAQGPRFLGSTGALVCTTDAYHALRTARNYVTTFTVVFYINRATHEAGKPKLRKIITDALILAAIRNIGFCASYSLIFRQQPYHG